MVNDRKELGVLVLLGILVAVFAFTLGVHLGKRVGPDGMIDEQVEPTALVPEVGDQTPERQELLDQERNVPEFVESTLDESLKAEVKEAGIQLDSPVQTRLPEKTKAETAGETDQKNRPELSDKKIDQALTSLAAATRKSPKGRFTLQVGSHRTPEEAARQVKELESKGLTPFLRSVLLQSKGRWYRVYLGGYDTMNRAEESGLSMKTSGAIESFLVTNQVP